MSDPLRPSPAPPAPSDGVAPIDENQLIAERRAKLAALRATGIAFPNDARPRDRAGSLFAAHDGK
jgi:lysyl-tRNA synthetase class 2